MKVVVEGNSTVNKAATELGVPRTTLGRVLHGTKLKPKPHLDITEEKNCLNFSRLQQRWAVVKLESK